MGPLAGRPDRGSPYTVGLQRGPPPQTAMKRTLLLAALAAAPLLTTSCSSGPSRLARSWDGWTNQKYSEDSWIHGALLQDIIPAYPIVGFIAGIGDWLILNPIQFWTKDIWDRRGTAYEYTQSSGEIRSVTSFFEQSEGE